MRYEICNDGEIEGVRGGIHIDGLLTFVRNGSQSRELPRQFFDACKLPDAPTTRQNGLPQDEKQLGSAISVSEQSRAS